MERGGQCERGRAVECGGRALESGAAVLFAGCRAKEAFDKADIAHELNKSGSTRDLLKDVANDRYTPPKDGHLTDGQVQMYLKVRDHEKDIAQVAKKQAQEHADAAKKAGEKSITGMMEGFKTLASAADMATADIRAAKDLHYNTQEYLWVKGQIIAASLSAADVHLLSLHAGLEGLLVPSKLYGILASGRPVCYIGPPSCEGAKVVRDNDLGWEGRNGDAAGLAQAVANLAKDGIRWDSICRRARAVFETHYDRPICVGRWLDVLTEVL